MSYDVYAFNRSVDDSHLDDDEGFISPTGVFMHIAGRIQHPVTVAIKPYQNWDRISTGLDPVEGRPITGFPGPLVSVSLKPPRCSRSVFGI